MSESLLQSGKQHMSYAKRLPVLFLCFLTAFPGEAPAQLKVNGTLWETPEIKEIPDYCVIATDSVRSLIYEGLPYKGRKQQVFAYFATPGMLRGSTEDGGKLPAVVLVHGGGGAAFKEWVIRWARRGYAAIAMDLRGNGEGRKPLPGGFEEPDGRTPYFEVGVTLEEQWLYHAVANAIRAHTLIRSFPEVDSSRTAVSGISWGGVIACILAGLDDRYKAAVPVYGCGYLGNSGRMKEQLGHLRPEDRETWLRQYDPSRYIGRSDMPVLFINSVNDPYFELPSYMRTCQLARKSTLCLKIGLQHSHRAGWSNPEADAFLDSYLKDRPGLPEIGTSLPKNGRAIARIRSPVRTKDVFLNYTTDKLSESAEWHTRKAVFRRGRIISRLPPEGTTAWFFSLKDERGLTVSGPVRFISHAR